jgi:4a-hydroxytetrahydrobiopterin dehydratase
MTSDGISARQFKDAGGTEDWRVVTDGACAFFRTGSLAESARLVAAIGALPNVDAQFPDLDVRKHGVTARLITTAGDYYGMSQRDVDLARAISAAAGELGFAPDLSKVQGFLVIAGAADTAEVMPFWQAVLGYERRADTPDEDLVDPLDRGPAFWFERMKQPRTNDGGGAIHVAVWLPIEHAETRVQAALAAGGHLVREHPPESWTLADAAGNEADIATIEGRD